MPILLDSRNGTFVLQCLNGHRDSAGNTTMLVVEEFLSIPMTSIPGMMLGSPGDLTIRCYYCSICGYVEMYAPSAKRPYNG